MAFSFGSTAAAPAPSFGGFGAPAPAPATGGGFNFGAPASTPGPAPAPGGFGFGSPAPAPGGAPAPAPFSFGQPPAPAPAFGFGSPAPAPSSGFSSFGNTASNPAPSTGFSFGGSTALTPAPAAFGSPAGNAPQVNNANNISGSTPYSSLPPEMQKAFDAIHEAMMRHKRTIANIQTMAPKLLISKEPAQADMAAGTGTAIVAASGGPGNEKGAVLATTLHKVKQEITALQQDVLRQVQLINNSKQEHEFLITQSIVHGKWPVEQIAIRRGVHLTPLPQHQANQQSNQSTSNNDLAKKDLDAVLDRQMAHVDRVERMPCPYLWQVIHHMEQRLTTMLNQVRTLQRQLLDSQTNGNETINVATIVQSQFQALSQCSAKIGILHEKVQSLRHQYRLYEKGENVLDKADIEEFQRKQRMDEMIRMQYLQSAGTTQQQQQGPAPGQAPGTQLGFGSPAPATGSSLFGQPAPAPALGAGTSLFGQPTSGSAFGQTPAPASSSGSLFGSSTPAPAGGSLFGSAPAPAGGSLFGAPAPAPSLFGNTTPAPSATPAAPAFGSTAPATPAPAFGFASTTSSSSSTPKSKNKNSRSSRLRR